MSGLGKATDALQGLPDKTLHQQLRRTPGARKLSTDILGVSSLASNLPLDRTSHPPTFLSSLFFLLHFPPFSFSLWQSFFFKSYHRLTGCEHSLACLPESPTGCAEDLQLLSKTTKLPPRTFSPTPLSTMSALMNIYAFSRSHVGLDRILVFPS